jgi:chromosome segregation ATPase
MGESKSLSTYSFRVTPDVKEQLEEIMEQGDFKTVNQMVEALTESYLNPKKMKSNQKELEQRIQEITAENEKLTRDYQAVKKGIEAIDTKHVEFLEEINTLTEALEAAKAKIPDENTMIIPVTEFHRKVLESLCKRENRKRNRTDLVPEIFVMFVIEEMLVNANVFTIDVLPSDELRRIKNECKQSEK